MNKRARDLQVGDLIWVTDQTLFDPNDITSDVQQVLSVDVTEHPVRTVTGWTEGVRITTSHWNGSNDFQLGVDDRVTIATPEEFRQHVFPSSFADEVLR